MGLCRKSWAAGPGSSQTLAHQFSEALQTDATYPPGVLCFLIEHTFAINGESCILACSGPTQAAGLRSPQWLAEYAVFSGVVSDLLNVIAFDLGMQKSVLQGYIFLTLNIQLTGG